MKNLSLLLSLGIAATLASQAASAADACSGLSGTYTLKTTGAHFIARLETYTTKITIAPDQTRLAIDSNWGPDRKITINTELHTVAESGNDRNFGTNIAGGLGDYLYDLNHVNFQLTQLQMLKVRAEKSDPKAADALECAIEKVAGELAFARLQQIAIEQAGRVQFQKVSSDVNVNKTVTVIAGTPSAQQQQQTAQPGASQTKAQ